MEERQRKTILTSMRPCTCSSEKPCLNSHVTKKKLYKDFVLSSTCGIPQKSIHVTIVKFTVTPALEPIGVHKKKDTHFDFLSPKNISVDACPTGAFPQIEIGHMCHPHHSQTCATLRRMMYNFVNAHTAETLDFRLPLKQQLRVQRHTF